MHARPSLVGQQEALSAFFRLSKVLEFGWSGNYKNKRYSTSHILKWKQLASQIEDFKDVHDGVYKTLWDQKFKTDLTSFKSREGKIMFSEINIYTDGSKTISGTGAGFVIRRGRMYIHGEKSRTQPRSSKRRS